MAIDVEHAYRRYGPMVLRRCRQMLKDEQLATDAMQDVFVQLLRNQARLEDRGMSSLLYRIATNTCLNKIRSQQRRPQTPIPLAKTKIPLAEAAAETTTKREMTRLAGQATTTKVMTTTTIRLAADASHF